MTRKIGAGIFALAVKIVPKLFSMIVKFVKFAKVGKFGLAIGSMAAYAYLFTWQFALMVIVSLFFHESGHIWAMKRCGLKTKGIYFIPFIGAAAVSDEMFKSRRDEVYIAIMGPIWGFGLALLTALIWIITGNALFAAAAGWMAMVNLFNLLPISPLDGGRIMKSITFSVDSRIGFIFLAIGIVISTVLTIWARMILFVFLLLIGLLELIFEYIKGDANRVINICVKDIDKIISKGPSDSITRAANDIKNILLNEKEDPLARIETIISLQTETNRDESTRVLSHILSYKLDMVDYMPKMAIKGIIASAIAYVAIVGILWVLMSYMNSVPEVEIARKFFMS